MKKLLVALLTVICCISCVACGKETNTESEVYTKGQWYYDELENAIEYLRENVEYPESVEISNVIIYTNDDYTSEEIKNGVASIDFYIEYFADNVLGNSQKGYATYYITPSVHFEDLDYKVYESVYKKAHGRDEDFKESSKGYYINENDSAVFEVDLQDYENEGYYLP